MSSRLIGFVPSAPLLVPAVAGGSAAIDADLRAACRSVVSSLVGGQPGCVVVVAGWPGGGSWDETHTWGFEGFGVPRQPRDDRPRLPWPLGIGAWLLDDAGWAGPRRYLGVAGAGPDAEDGALLVVGDGTARRTEKAPGHLDDRAEGYDAEIARCLRDGDIAGLGGLDEELGADLMCGGLDVWRWLAESLHGQTVARAALLAETAPYGVGYFAATWELN